MTPDARLFHVYWVGGSPCSGKSTVVDRLADRHGMRVYRCDDAYFRHSERTNPDTQPVFHRLAHSTPDEVWLRPVQQQIAEEIALYREEFPMILDDLLRLPSDRPIIAEGAALMPSLLATIDIPSDRTLWMVPTEAFQRHHYTKREWRHDVLRECSDPARAWENWMDRDAGFGREIATQARDLGKRVLIIDGSQQIEAVTREVTSYFNLESKTGS